MMNNACQDNDPVPEFNKLYEKYFPYIQWVTKKLVVDCDEANDITSAVFNELNSCLIEHKHIDHIQGFLSRIAYFKSVDYFRRKQRDEKDKLEYGNYIGRNFYFLNEERRTEEQYEIINKQIKQLPRRLKDVVLLFLKGQSNLQIAVALNVDPKSVRQYKYKAFKILREKVRAEFY